MPTSTRLVRAAAFAVAALSLTAPARTPAQWPPPPTVTRDQLSQPQYWPDDPGYGPRGPNDDGQWYMWSWVPQRAAALPRFRTDELQMGAGNHVDRAWQLSIGDPRILISVLDSGIKWDEADLAMKAALNIGELPLPQQWDGSRASAYDANGDGMINVDDYANDARVRCGAATLPHNPLRCRDAANQPNDPNGNGILDAGDLIRTFSDGVDDDRNGYIDDISGWDFLMDDNDPYDDTRYGHGTGEARDSSAAANNAMGDAGVCPRCMFVPLRVGDSFIADVNDFAQAVVYATDLDYGQGRRVRVIQEALGTLNNSAFAMRAIDYAYANGRVVIASAADENSRHHNMPGTNNHTVYVHAIRYNGANAQASTTYLSFNNCTNYGGQLQLSVGAISCSSASVGLLSGMAGLAYSYGLQTNLDPPLNAEEVRQIFVNTADDVYLPESQPLLPTGATNPSWDPTLYPSLPGWDQRFGHGRTNMRSALDRITTRRIPPEVDIQSPRWFTSLFADRPSGQRLVLEGRIAARRTSTTTGCTGGAGTCQDFDYVIEWAKGIEPKDSDWQPLRSEQHVTAPITGRLAELDVSSLNVDNAGEVENRFTITVRIRAVAHYGGTLGDVAGQDRRVFYVTRDTDLLPGFPVDLTSSGESSPHSYDLNGDGRPEIVLATSDGRIHAIKSDGTELAGFPVHTNLGVGFDTTRTPVYRSAPAYAGTAPAIDPETLYETVIATPAIGDLDADGTPEIVAAGYHGTVYAWNHDGTPYGHGFPRVLPRVCSKDDAACPVARRMDTKNVIATGIFGSPVLADLNGDARPEIVFGAFDGDLYALDAATAGDLDGFPVQIRLPVANAENNRLFGSVGVGKIDGDNIPDILVVSNIRHPTDDNTGSVFVVHGDGNRHAGGPFHPNWPVVAVSFNLFPMIGEGISTAPPIGDVDGDGRDDFPLLGNGLPTMPVLKGAQPARSSVLADPTQLERHSILATGQRGPLSDARGALNAFLPAFALPSFGDMTNDGELEIVSVGAPTGLAINLAGGGKRNPFDHLAGAWNARTGRVLDGFPKVVEDYGFFMNPTVADVSGDAYAEMIVGTGGYYLRAFDACGREAPGFPKFTGQWIIPSPNVDDLDGDGRVEVTTNTRTGYLYAWRTRGAANGSTQWPTFRHDPQNTGNYGTALGRGRTRITDQPALVCPAPPQPDAGVPADAGSAADAGGSGLVRVRGGGVCQCSAPGRSSTVDGRVLALLALAAGAARIARRRSPSRSARG